VEEILSAISEVMALKVCLNCEAGLQLMFLSFCVSQEKMKLWAIFSAGAGDYILVIAEISSWVLVLYCH